MIDSVSHSAGAAADLKKARRLNRLARTLAPPLTVCRHIRRRLKWAAPGCASFAERMPRRSDRKIEGQRHGILKLRQIRDAADLFEQLLVLQLLLNRDDINRLPRVEHLREHFINRLMAKVVKKFRAAVLQFFDALAEAFVRRKQRATEHAHFSLRRMWRQTVNGGASVRASRFLASRLLQICRCACTVGNGINHVVTKPKITLCNNAKLLKLAAIFFTFRYLWFAAYFIAVIMNIFLSVFALIALLEMPCYGQDHFSLSEELLHSTIRIVGIQTNGTTSVGTGFFYNFTSDTDTNGSIPVIVTCKHVVSGSVIGVLDFALAKTNAFGRTQPHFQITIPNFESRWMQHPDTNIDIAIFPIAPIMQELIDQGKRLDVVPFDKRELLTTNDQIGAFQNVKFIGYPIGISDELNNLPIARQGMTATDVSIDYEGRKEFLIDAAVFPGSSGSPVLIVDEGSFATGNGFAFGNRVRLLGIISQVNLFNATGRMEKIDVPTSLVSQPVTSFPGNLGFVIKAEVLNDFEKPLFDLVQKNPAKK